MNFALTDLALLCALGSSHTEISENALRGVAPGMRRIAETVPGKNFFFGSLVRDLPEAETAEENLRCNRILLALVQQLAPSLQRLRERYRPERVGIVLGTSNTGVEEAQRAVNVWLETQACPPEFSLSALELGTPAVFLKKITGFGGPAFSVSTACSSGTKAFASARNLLKNGVCDAVIVGGVDSLCRFAMNGFFALQALDENRALPMSRNRAGINLGEGGALFVMERGNAGIGVLGVGESSDAYHLTAPHPEGLGAKAAMAAALADANLSAADIDYINLHGTGTLHNDAMESRAVYEIFGGNVLCSSSKPLTGHALGSSGAIEAGLAWLLLKRCCGVIPHVFDGERDETLAPIRLASATDAAVPVRKILSNSFAFGGSNASVILGEIS